VEGKIDKGRIYTGDHDIEVQIATVIITAVIGEGFKMVHIRGVERGDGCGKDTATNKSP
jgi:hypothetical protein